MAPVIQLFPASRFQGRADSPARTRLQAANSNGLLPAAVEPSGTEWYVEAVREWIERVTPRSSSHLRSAR